MRDRRVVTLSSPYPLLDAGRYLAVCTEATFAWARQWKKWMARLVLEPQDYAGRSYSGKLCKFLSLGTDPSRPFAGQHSAFRQLWVELNGGQPTSPEVTMRIFEGTRYCINVETVTLDRGGNQRPAAQWYSVVREIHLARPACPQHSNTPPANPSIQKTLRTREPFNRPTQQHSKHTPWQSSKGNGAFDSLKKEASFQNDSEDVV